MLYSIIVVRLAGLKAFWRIPAVRMILFYSFFDEIKAASYCLTKIPYERAYKTHKKAIASSLFLLFI